MIICFILITKSLILCEQYKKNLHTDKLSGAERVQQNESFKKAQMYQHLTSAAFSLFFLGFKGASVSRTGC